MGLIVQSIIIYTYFNIALVCIIGPRSFLGTPILGFQIFDHETPAKKASMITRFESVSKILEDLVRFESSICKML